MDFSKESFNLVRDELPWPKTADEANELWRKRVKPSYLPTDSPTPCWRKA